MKASSLLKLAKQTVTSEYADIHKLYARYDTAVEAYLATVTRRPLISLNKRIYDTDKAVRVEYSSFWAALEIMSQRLGYVLENMDRKAFADNIAKFTRSDWEQLEKAYIGTGKKEGESCRAWNCVKPPRRKRSAYCSEECRKEQKAAVLRFKKTGTYLPKKAYMPYRSEYAEKLQSEVEVPIEFALGIATDGRDYRHRRRRTSEDEY